MTNKFLGWLRRCARRVNTWFNTYKLTVGTAFSLLVLTGLSYLGLFAFVDYSIAKARSIQSELFERDLRDLANHYDADERFVLERNLVHLTTLARPLGPMLLPRQYYISLPPGRSHSLPRQPPRNCFVDLVSSLPQPNAIVGPDRFCAYFTENPGPGEYIFMNVEVNDSSIVPLRPGDITMAADSLDISFEFGKTKSNWRVAIQSINQDNQGRYEITAFRHKQDGIIERDRRLEGWAYTVRQPDGSQKLYILARLDMHEFVSESESATNDANWPPDGWDRARFKIKRYDYTNGNARPNVIVYNENGNSTLSIPSLASTIFAARSTLDIRVVTGDAFTVQHIAAPEAGKQIDDLNLFKFVDGDILVRNNPYSKIQSIPDTNLQLVVTHPGMVIEKGVWRVFLLLLTLAIGAIIAVIYFYRRLLKPIFVLSKRTRTLEQHGTDGELLPYESRKDEIGTLATAFNELIRRIRTQVERELQERTERDVQETARRAEALRNREENLNIIGHEIRSPLQALISLHLPNSESRRYLDRILGALPHLQQGMAAEDAISARRLNLETVDMTQLMPEIARNANLVNIPNVVFEGEKGRAAVSIDVEAFEDVIDNILRNADRHRKSGTLISITLRRVETGISIRVTNEGDPIPSDAIGKIFDYGFSTVPKANGDVSGIGLWIAKLYLAKMRGTIMVQNVPGGEVAFEIIFPEDTNQT